MPLGEIVKRNAVLGIVGVASAIVATRFEPFKSSLSLSIMAGVVMGVIGSMIELAAKKLKPSKQ